MLNLSRNNHVQHSLGDIVVCVPTISDAFGYFSLLNTKSLKPVSQAESMLTAPTYSDPKIANHLFMYL